MARGVINQIADSDVSSSGHITSVKSLSLIDPAPSRITITQPVDINYMYQSDTLPVLPLFDNYIYLYHTDTLIIVPTWPEAISDAMNVTFAQSTPLSRSAPIYSYSNSGPRSFSVSLHLHRDLMNEVNVSAKSMLVPDLIEEDYIDILINQMQASVLPRYAAAEKMVNPPIVAVKFGTDIFCKGVLMGGLTTTYSGPILRTNKYAEVTIDFNISEIDPYDADTVMTTGGYRGILTTDLERRIHTVADKIRGSIQS